MLCRDQISIDNGYTPPQHHYGIAFFPFFLRHLISSYHSLYVARMTFSLALARWIWPKWPVRLARCSDRDLPNGMPGTLSPSGCRLRGAADRQRRMNESHGQRWDGIFGIEVSTVWSSRISVPCRRSLVKSHNLQRAPLMTLCVFLLCFSFFVQFCISTSAMRCI